jgi:predicted transposase YbfD/YdcC
VTVLTTIRAITEKIDVINATNATNVIDLIGAIGPIDAANAKKKFVENALEQIAKRYAMYLYVILVNQTTKKRETINVYS